MFPVELESASFDLSKATKLRDTVFRLGSLRVEWINVALKTITPDHRDLRQISIYLPSFLTSFRVGVDIRRSIGQATSRGWSDLDHLLVQFWESCSVRPRIGCEKEGEQYRRSTEYCIGSLLPEITKRGIVDPV